jgi:hypothetical protein
MEPQKITLLQSLMIAGESCPVGSDVEVSPSFARELIALGLAKPFIETAAEPKKKK